MSNSGLEHYLKTIARAARNYLSRRRHFMRKRREEEIKARRRKRPGPPKDFYEGDS